MNGSCNGPTEPPASRRRPASHTLGALHWISRCSKLPCVPARGFMPWMPSGSTNSSSGTEKGNAGCSTQAADRRHGDTTRSSQTADRRPPVPPSDTAEPAQLRPDDCRGNRGIRLSVGQCGHTDDRRRGPEGVGARRRPADCCRDRGLRSLACRGYLGRDHAGRADRDPPASNGAMATVRARRLAMHALRVTRWRRRAWPSASATR